MYYTQRAYTSSTDFAGAHHPAYTYIICDVCARWILQIAAVEYIVYSILVASQLNRTDLNQPHHVMVGELQKQGSG